MYSKEIKIKENTDNGYAYFIDKGHPLASGVGKVYLHRHMASLKIGRWILGNEHVHHIDGNRLNNSVENLVILTKSDHSRIHRLQSGGIEIQEKTCPVCGGVFKAYQKSKYCSRKCLGIFSRKVKRPSIDQIKKDLSDLKYFSAVGRKYGVSDNAIRKWIRAH